MTAAMRRRAGEEKPLIGESLRHGLLAVGLNVADFAARYFTTVIGGRTGSSSF
jgi:hypothetical protein